MDIERKGLLYCAPPQTAPTKPASGGIEKLICSADSHSLLRVDEANLAAYVDAAERYRSQLLWVAARVTNRYEDAEDIVQLALLKAFTNLSLFRGESQMKTWLTAIVRNASLEYVRNQHARVFVPEGCAPLRDRVHDLDLPDPSMNPEEHYGLQEQGAIVSAAINRMSRINRRVLQMCVLDEHPYIQAATELNVPLSTIKSRIFRGRREIKTAISIHATRLK